jgi:hypothetical protein
MPGNQSLYPTSTFLVANVTSTTQATSVGTGALIVSGGMSCFGNLHVGGTITGGSISYASTSTGTLTVTNTPNTTFNVTSNQQATSVGTGCAVFQGGMSCFGNLHVGGTITGGSIVYSSTSTGTLTVTNSPNTTVTIQSTQDSVSKATGALTTLGGIGVDKNISAESTRLFGTTQSTTTSTGTLIVGGGIGLGGNIFIGGSAQSQTLNLTSVTDSTSKATGSLITVGGLGVDKNISAESARLFSTTASTTTTTGALIVGGGIGLGGNIFAGGTAQATSLNLTSGTESTTTTTGSLTTPGGVGIVKNLRVGGNAFVTGETTSLLTRTTGSSAADINNIVQNTLGGTGSIAIERILNDTGAGLVLYINSSGRTGDSGPNNANIRNDIGNITFAAQTNTLLLSSSLTSSVPILTTANVTSTNPTTGSLIVTGGAGVSGRLSVGSDIVGVGNLVINGSSTLSSLNLTSGTESTTTTTGSLTTPGGVGIVKNLRVGGSVFVTGETTSVLTRSTNSSSSDVNTITQNTLNGANSIAINRIINDSGAGLVLYINSSGRVGDSGPNNATIRNDIGNITFAAQTNTLLLSSSLTSSVPILTTVNVASTNPTTGSLIVTGGAGISGRLSVGANAVVVGNITGQSINSTSFIQATGFVINGGFDFILGNADQSSRGNSGDSRALVKDAGNTLHINFAGDYTGGTYVDTGLAVNGFFQSDDFYSIPVSIISESVNVSALDNLGTDILRQKNYYTVNSSFAFNVSGTATFSYYFDSEKVLTQDRWGMGIYHLYRENPSNIVAGDYHWRGRCAYLRTIINTPNPFPPVVYPIYRYKFFLLSDGFTQGTIQANQFVIPNTTDLYLLKTSMSNVFSNPLPYPDRPPIFDPRE